MGQKRFTGKHEDFLKLARWEQREYDLRTLFETEPQSYLVASCIAPEHRDDTPSMLIYHDGVSCKGCGAYWWPDEFVRDLDGKWITTEMVCGPKYHGSTPISEDVALTFAKWLTTDGGPYNDRLPVMYARGLRRDTLILNQIGHNGEGFSIPIYEKWTGSLATIRFRRDDERAPERPKYWGTAGHNTPLPYVPVVSLGGPVRSSRPILVEGELDALRLAQEGYHAVAITNGAQALSRTVEKLIPEFKALGEEWLLCGDKDAVGMVAMYDVAKALNANGIQHAHVTWAPSLGKDVTDFLNRWPTNQLDEYIRRAEECVFASFIEDSTP